LITELKDELWSEVEGSIDVWVKVIFGLEKLLKEDSSYALAI